MSKGDVNRSFKEERTSISNRKSRQGSTRKNSKYGIMNKSNVYDSFSMSNKFLEMSSTPDNSKTRYVTGKNSNNNSYMGLKGSQNNIGDSESAQRMQKMRQSESTKPQRNGRMLGKTPSKSKNTKLRASSNPRMMPKDIHNASSTSIRGRKGQLMSSSKIGKIISDQTNALMKQKDRIQRIYEPGKSAVLASSSNIKVTDEFPSINHKKALIAASQAVANDRNSGQRYNPLSSHNQTSDSIK